MIDERFVALIHDPGFWRAASPELGVDKPTTILSALPSAGALERAREELRIDGYFRIEDVVPRDTFGPIRDGIARLVEQGWPPLFIYFYDEPWALYASMRAVLEGIVGAPYGCLREVWAWSLGPTSKAGGWAPHRDGNGRTLEDGAPQVLTVWIALTDATPDNGCVSILPASLDPHYADATGTDVSALANIRALPARAGTILGWTEQLLHWGGRSSRWAAGPRVSLSMSFHRTDVPLLRPVLTTMSIPPFRDRAELIGEQILKYAHMETASTELRALATILANEG